MSRRAFVAGLDYGTESARGVLIDTASGETVATHDHRYHHGVMDQHLPDGTPLPADWALQDADDYLAAAEQILGVLARVAGERGGDLVGLGIDFTACTPLPALADGTPLSRLHPGEPHAYVKLWKHHAAQPWADRINASGADYLLYTGGMTSCEWLLPKAGELRQSAPALWSQTERFIEAGDWLVWQLTGNECRSSCQAGYKAHYVGGVGYPDDLDTQVPGLRARLAEPRPIGQPAGEMTAEWVRRLGLKRAPVVAVATVDAHAVFPAVGVDRPGTLVASLGTSACHLMVDTECHRIPGVGGVVRDGILPGYWGYESGQAGFGDLLAWFVSRFPVTGERAEDFAHYNQRAARLAPGECGVLALDWLNGCRTPLMDPDMSGLFVGVTLQTSPVDLYRALLESLCFGTRRIVETHMQGGVAVHEVVVTSGLVEKAPFMVELMAQVTGRPVAWPEVREPTARGAAIHGAVAAGVVADFEAAIARYGARRARRVEPDDAAVAVYDQLYGHYRALSDYMAGSGIMPELRSLRARAR
jgi:L-ribulokinase